jgi:exopolyphosphatase/guanosine-5'-triphosphate,3'-diphosphate pyrophosphatase
VITGEREAGLSFLGGTRGLDGGSVPGAEPPFLVLDIGGGSTELVVGARAGRADHAISTRMGSVRLTERLVASDPPSKRDLAALEREARLVIEGAARDLPAVADAATLVSVAGTATTMQAIALGLDRYDPDRIHRTWLLLDDAERIVLDLAAMTNAERAGMSVMAPGRGDVIVAGGVILITVMHRFGFDRTLVSETDILDGLGFEMLGIG